jgi:hypothetical protein
VIHVTVLFLTIKMLLMKSNLYIHVIIFIIILLIGTNSSAQTPEQSPEGSQNSISNDKPVEFEREKIMLQEFSAAYINIKCVRDFISRFGNVENLHCYKITNAVLFYFDKDDIKIRCSYTNKGILLYMLKTYAEKKLPTNLRAQVKSTYYDYNITLVNEITVGDKTFHLVHLYGLNCWKNIRLFEGNMEEVETLPVLK